MSEFDRENEDVFAIVHDNPRRRGVVREVGIIVPVEEARRYAAYQAGRKSGGQWQGAAFMVIAVLAVIGMTVAALI